MGKKPLATGTENGPNTIFKATYSPVYEMICRDIAVMRRRSDGYLNATQILKVAGLDKPQRTRVLEREVQKGEHEKVQGGYGKYQGTWIPVERGLALSKQFSVEDVLRPIIDYRATSQSPPPAPKHIVAPPTRTKKDKESKAIKDLSTPTKTGPMSAAALQAQAQLSARNVKQAPIHSSPTDPISKSADDSMSTSPLGDEEEESVTPSPVTSVRALEELDPELGMGIGTSRKRSVNVMLEEDLDPYTHLRNARGNSAIHTPRSSPPVQPTVMADGPTKYTDHILNYFISETTQIPSFLITPPPDFDPNQPIDDDGHAPLHWACAMGRVRVVKLLLTAGASIFAANCADQTPLMRSVMFSNNYDVRKFAEIYELLHRSTLNIDKQNRTVFHHIANLALNKGKTHAARYYMETILSRLSDFPQELADVINFQDEEGETALTLAARARSRRLVKALLDHGADPKIRNRDLKSAEEYILEDERFRSSPIHERPNGIQIKDSPQLYLSEAARMAGGQMLSDLTTHMQTLARSFDSEAQMKDRDILQAKATLTSTHAEISDTTKIIDSLKIQIAPLEQKRTEYEQLQSALRRRVNESLKRTWETWEQSGRGEGMGYQGENEETLRWHLEEKRKRRVDLVRRYVKAQAEAGTSDKIAQYRRLISAGSGNTISPSDVDGMMTQLLTMLENDAEPYGLDPSLTLGMDVTEGMLEQWMA
ncbi:transcription factor [Tremella mesenterica]|uniref:Transcription factor n=1 Tax=Tremella mesenterica TaxID=5217 RepID=A0A4Q1BPV5_TREME|nr:transcription factor [Tremella mesenterica]